MTNKVFYSGTEAQKKLGVDRNRFNYLVRTGRIKKVILPGKKTALYSIIEVDKFATLIETAVNLYDPSQVHIEVAEENDLEEVYQIGVSLFGFTTPVDTLRKWLQKCPECIHVLKTGNDEIVGHFILLPMPEERAIEVISRKIIVGDIPINEIENFESDKEITLYVRQVAIIKTSDKNLEAQWGMILLAGAFTFIRNLGLRRIKIENIYALAVTKDGRRTCQTIGFNRLPIVPDPSKPNEVAYGMNIQESGVVFAKDYRENYKLSQKDSYIRVNPSDTKN